jgi:hypothetical protein
VGHKPAIANIAIENRMVIMGSGGFSLILTLVSGLCWTIVYIEGIRLGFRDKTYAMPLWALALNFFWEIFNSILGYKEVGFDAQVVINIIWAICDVFLVASYFLYGYRYAKQSLSWNAFIYGSLLVFAVAAVVEYAFIMEFGLAHGRAYAAFLQNLLMSVLFIRMFTDRRGGEGQSITIAAGKWIGTLAPTILFGLIGGGGLAPNTFLLIVGLLCSLFDIIYILLVAGKLDAWRPARDKDAFPQL